MKKPGFFFAFAFPLVAQISNVSVLGVTNTQAVLQYTAPDASACTVAVSTSPTYSPLVHDVDSSIFAGSNLDNRPGSMSSGVPRTFVAGTRDAEQGLNGHWYSRALQALTPHYYQIACGALTATGTFTTGNIALGNTYNDVLPPAPSAASNKTYFYTGQYAWPEFLNWNTADPAARQEMVIDPQTGMALKRLTMPQDRGHYDDHTFLSVAAPTGVWSNNNNALVDDAAYASYSGATSDWLVLNAGNLNLDLGSGTPLESLTFSAKAWCSGTCTGDRAKIQVCLTVNGVSCWPSQSNVYDIALGTASLPATLVSYGGGSASMFPWTPPGLPTLVSWDVRSRSGQVNVDASGNVFLSGITASASQFYPGWTAGSSIKIAGSNCSITSVTNPQNLVINLASCAPALTVPQTNAAYSAGNFGVMVRKKTADTDTINLQYAKYTLGVSDQLSWPSGGGANVTGIGVFQNTVVGRLGYLAVLGNTPHVYWIDSVTADANMLAVLDSGSGSGTDRWGNSGCGSSSVGFTIASPAGPVKYYCVNHDENGKTIILGCSFTTTGQAGSFSRSCQNLTPGSTGKDLLSLVASFTGGQFDTAAFNSSGMTGMQKGQLLLTSGRSVSQDVAAWLYVFNPTMVGTAAGCVGGGNPGCIVAAKNTWSIAPDRWSTLHSAQYSGEVDKWFYATKYFGGSDGLPGGGYYTSTVTSGAMTARPSIAAGASGCPAGSNGCDLVTVDGEPCIMNPAGPSQGHPGDPLNCPKNAAWSYLQDALPGDVFGTASGPLEYMKLISKSGNQWLFQRALGWPTASTGPIAPSTPIRLIEESLSRSDNFAHGVSTLAATWDYVADPLGQNANGTTVTVPYEYDHQVARAHVVVGDGPFYDTNNPLHGGYAIMDGVTDAASDPNKYAQIGPTFAGTIGLTGFNEVAQDHPSWSQDNAPDSEKKWFLDARPLSGPGGTVADLAALVSGQLYKFPSTTADGDTLTFVGGSVAASGLVSRKIQATMAFCGTQPLIDISSASTGNTIAADSSSSYQYCVARKAGECRTGSARGDIYMNCAFVNPRRNYSETIGCNNIFTENGLGSDLCINNPGMHLNGIAQIGYQDVVDATGKNQRTLTHGLIRYRLNNVNENVRTTPDGAQLMFEGVALNGSEYQILSAKMLPYPPVDSVNRTTFVPMAVQLKPPNGISVDNATIKFGYAENGAAGQFYCTSRHEACLAVAATVPADPFKFPSDSPDGTVKGLTGLSCASGCSIVIPALSQRVVYYQVLYRDSGNNVVAQTAMQAAITP